MAWPGAPRGTAQSGAATYAAAMHAPASACRAPIGLPLTCVVRTWLKKNTELKMMATRLTTLHTPCETGLTRSRVLNANCAHARSSEQRTAGKQGCVPRDVDPTSHLGGTCLLGRTTLDGDRGGGAYEHHGSQKAGGHWYMRFTCLTRKAGGRSCTTRASTECPALVQIMDADIRRAACLRCTLRTHPSASAPRRPLQGGTARPASITKPRRRRPQSDT